VKGGRLESRPADPPFTFTCLYGLDRLFPCPREIPVQYVLLRLVPLRVIAFRDRYRAVSKRTAHFANVHARLEQFHAERVPEHV